MNKQNITEQSKIHLHLLRNRLSDYFKPVIGIESNPKIWQPKSSDSNYNIMNEILTICNILLDQQSENDIFSYIHEINTSSLEEKSLLLSCKYQDVCAILSEIKRISETR
jgi:hypothetical protein